MSDKVTDNSSNSQPPVNVTTEFEEQSIRTTSTIMGVVIAIALASFAILLSYKIYQAMGTEHQGFAIIFGIPLNIVLYILVYKSLQVGKRELVKDKDGNEEFVIGKSSVLPVWLMIPLKIIATIIFGFALYIGVSSSSVYLIFTSLILLLWTHYNYLKTHFSWINTNKFMTVAKYTLLFLIFIRIIMYLKDTFF